MGAECIEISKDFFVKNASENYLRKLKAMVNAKPNAYTNLSGNFTKYNSINLNSN